MNAPQFALIAAGPVPTTVADVVHGMVRASGGAVRDTRFITLPDDLGMAFRVAFDCSGRDPASVREIVSMIGGRYPGLVWRFASTAEPARTLLLAGPTAHCADDLLSRHRTSRLPVEIVAVASNHTTVAPAAAAAGVAFEHVSTADGQAEVEEQLRRLIKSWDVRLVVMARWMRVLSAEFCRWLAEHGVTLLNIHHSPLPAFIGARAYEQAATRGVRFVGVTVHYVTADGELDRGPILVQRVREHHLVLPTGSDLAALGRELEVAALAEAVDLHARACDVLLPNNRLAVFS